MANTELRFKCLESSDDFLTVESKEDIVNIEGVCNGRRIDIIFDVSTAIKFAKTVRTEINKAKEVQNETN